MSGLGEPGLDQRSSERVEDIGRGVPVICRSNARFFFGQGHIQSTYTPTGN